MYKIWEKSAVSALKRASKLGAPEWLVKYAEWKITRAKHFRVEAGTRAAKDLGLRALREAAEAVDVLSAYIESTKKK